MFGFFKKFLKYWFRNFLCFLGLSYFYLGFKVNGELETLLILGALMTIVELFFKPLLKMLLLPVNVITFGMFSWLLTTVELLIVVYLVDKAEFIAFSMENLRILGMSFGGMSVNILFSVILGTIIFNFLDKLIESLSG